MKFETLITNIIYQNIECFLFYKTKGIFWDTEQKLKFNNNLLTDFIKSVYLFPCLTADNMTKNINNC